MEVRIDEYSSGNILLSMGYLWNLGNKEVNGMGDLISRQAAIDLFPNDSLEWDTYRGYIAPHLARQMIEKLPSEQPEIIRCKECKHRPSDPHNDHCGNRIEFPDDVCPCQCDDPWYNYMPEDDWYCASAERKEE